ncbi:MAG: Gfo/Idh/MocA family oxidoreductase [Fibrobacteria bacterium]|nr:Gfo/Idh/MocA family oxidoreductase [Fibrobacteria bacterium]
MDKVRLGLIGVGGIGKYHADRLLEGKVKNCELTAIADKDESALAKFKGPKTYTDSSAMMASGEIDAVHIATPHFLHTSLGIEALNQGLHVLVEKPISVHKKDCEKLIAAHSNKDLVFSAMFNQRTAPAFNKLKQLILDGELGEITRVNWIITDWFRTASYYANGRWRATWKGEGGGVLLNQCPHQLDLLQWLCGMPSKVRGFAHLGAKHDIEVEDQVTAYLEWANGATGVFITTTGEAPGTNRFELAGERGKVVIENDKLFFTRNEQPMSEFSKNASGGFDQPDIWNIEIPLKESPDQHVAMLQNFVNAIVDGEALIAPAEEGINSVELANATLYSSLMGETIELPLDSEAYANKLDSLIATSNYDQKVVKKVEQNMDKSF